MPVIGRAFVAWKNWTRWIQGRWGPTIGLPSGTTPTNGPATPTATDFSNRGETIHPPLSQPMWLRDPFGLSSLRFWDGEAWTSWESNGPYDVRVGQVRKEAFVEVLARWDEPSPPNASASEAEDSVESKLAILLEARHRMRSGELSTVDYERIRQRVVSELTDSAGRYQE